MKTRRFLPLLLAALALPVAAQTPWAPADMEAEKTRIDGERKSIDARYDEERAVCYKKFAVQDCLTDARRRRRAQVEDLNRQEAILNDAERKRRAAAALERLDEKASPASATEEAANRERAQQSQQGREQRAAERAADRQAKDEQAAANRRAFEERQRAHAQEQAKTAERRSQDQIERERYEAKLKQAEQERAELEARNAKRTKPRSPPLPTPPP